MDTPSASNEVWKKIAGPTALGRSVLIEFGADVPLPWSRCDRISLTPESIVESSTLEVVRHAFLTRTPLVVEIHPDLRKPEPGQNLSDFWEIEANFDFVAEATWRLATLNAVDARVPTEPRWLHTEKALTLGASPPPGGSFDIALPDGTLAWCDGGPLHLWESGDSRLDGGAVVPRAVLAKGRLQPIAPGPVEADLAEDQLRAVADPSVRARIIAPAGSGKTRVLTERARHLVRSGVPTESMLMVAYNRRAGDEMRERTRDLAGLEILTFNALALAIVNGTRGFLDRRDRRQVQDTFAVRGIIPKLVDFPRKTNTDPVAAWIGALTLTRLGLTAAEDVEVAFGGDVDGFAEFFPRYRQHLADNGLADHDEIVLLAVEALLREPRVRFAAERKAEVLLVDEFQDLSPAHMLLLRLLAGPALSIFAVGDDDQTLYGFNGASPEWLVEFGEHVPDAVHHALEVNYRCPAPVITAASKLVSHNTERVVKEIRPGPKNVADPESLTIVRAQDQTRVVIDRVNDLLASGAAPADIVVLSRVNLGLLPPFVALEDAGVPVTARDVGDLLCGSGISAALAWLRLGTRPTSMTAADITLATRRPSRGIHPKIVDWMGRQKSLTDFDELLKKLENPAADKVGDFVRDLRRLVREVDTGTTWSAIEFICKAVGLDRALATLDVSRYGRNTSANSDGIRSLMALARRHSDPKTFERWLRETLAKVQDPEGVLLATVHKVKGQEWPHVIVYDVSDEVFPHRLSQDIEEERRVLHVAITRCQRSLTLTADVNAPSFFLTEMTVQREPTRDVPERTSMVRGSPERPLKESAMRPKRSQGGPPRTGTRSRTPSPVEAAVGLHFRWSGYDCVASAVNEVGVQVSFGTTHLTVSFGSMVQIRGDYKTLVDRVDEARVAVGPSNSELLPELREALRMWRLEQAQSDEVPAFVVFNNRTLDELSRVRPRTMRDLLGVEGIGPMRADRYGDQILAVIEEILGG
jgi:DNA helicase-2/ATP-dependent DNA helicase PcrA